MIRRWRGEKRGTVITRLTILEHLNQSLFLILCSEKIGKETALLENQIDALKLTSVKLEDSKSINTLDVQMAHVKEESEKLGREQDRKAMKKLQEQREELKQRLERNLTAQEGKSERDKTDLLIEEDIIRKKKAEVEKLLQEERKRR